MRREKSRDNAQGLHSVKLIFADGLAMDDNMAGIVSRALVLSRCNGFDNILNGLVTVGMDGHLPPIPMRL